jgi:multicomponent Na+:H+ antiporter subunit E
VNVNRSSQNNNSVHPETAVREPANLLVTFLWRVVLLALFWLLLNATDSASWIIGIPSILVAASFSMQLAPPRAWHWRPWQVVRFLPVFLLESVKGGIDVSLRVFRPGMRLRPVVVDYRLRLPNGLPRLLMLNVVSLLPGTLSADLQDNCLRLHVLDKNTSYENELRRIESYIEKMFHAKEGSS